MNLNYKTGLQKNSMNDRLIYFSTLEGSATSLEFI